MALAGGLSSLASCCLNLCIIVITTRQGVNFNRAQVLENSGEHVRLQRNALTVIEFPQESQNSDVSAAIPPQQC